MSAISRAKCLTKPTPLARRPSARPRKRPRVKRIRRRERSPSRRRAGGTAGSSSGRRLWPAQRKPPRRPGSWKRRSDHGPRSSSGRRLWPAQRKPPRRPGSWKRRSDHGPRSSSGRAPGPIAGRAQRPWGRGYGGARQGPEFVLCLRVVSLLGIREVHDELVDSGWVIRQANPGPGLFRAFGRVQNDVGFGGVQNDVARQLVFSRSFPLSRAFN